MADSSFDIVSKYDKQEIANAVNTAAKEIANRYDFKNVGASIELSGDKIVMKANSEERVKAVLDVLQTWLVKRKVSLKHLDGSDADPKLSGKEYRLECALKEGISQENAKKIAKIIRDEGPRGVKAQIQGDELRVSSKSKDDLQAVMTLLKGQDLDVALTFTNYRSTPKGQTQEQTQGPVCRHTAYRACCAGGVGASQLVRVRRPKHTSTAAGRAERTSGWRR